MTTEEKRELSPEELEREQIEQEQYEAELAQERTRVQQMIEQLVSEGGPVHPLCIDRREDLDLLFESPGLTVRDKAAIEIYAQLLGQSMNAIMAAGLANPGALAKLEASGGKLLDPKDPGFDLHHDAVAFADKLIEAMMPVEQEGGGE